MAFGTKNLQSTGRDVRVSADGRPEWKAGGITIDWSTVAAVNTDTTLYDGTVIPNGSKYLRYGTVMCLITASGAYGPYASGAADGRQNLVRGQCFILDHTKVMGQLGADQTGAIEGGSVFLSRIIGTNGVTTNPTETNLLAAFPRLSLVRD